MNPGPPDDPFRSAMHYADEQPVDLDVTSIVARGTRIRRRRRLTRVSAAAVCAVVPLSIALASNRSPTTSKWSESAPDTRGAAAGTSRTIRGAGEAEPAFGDHGSGASGSNGYVNGPAGLPSSLARRVPARVALSVTLPQTYDPIDNMAGDSTGSGVWFWDLRKEIKIFHLSRNGHLESWPVLPVTKNVLVGSDAGFDVTSGGVAWLGLDHTLIRFDVRSGKVQTWTIPAPRANPAARKYQPPSAKDLHQVQALAIQPGGGKVAIADLGDASSVQVFNPATGKFSQVMMPSVDDAPVALGYARNGTLGVGYEHVGSPHTSGVVIRPTSGTTVSRALPDSYGVAAYGADSLLVGTYQPYVVSGAGVMRPLVMPASKLVTFMVPAQLPGNRLATIADGTILTFPADARSTSQARAESVVYEAPVTKCGTGVPGSAGATTTLPPGRAARTCHLDLGSLVTDPAGDLWVMVSGLTIDLLVPR
jgi:hypothetical protein